MHKRCPGCGKPIIGRTEEASYCSNACYKRWFGSTKPCPHNPFVGCTGLPDCANCGWSPDVEAARKKELEERYGTG